MFPLVADQNNRTVPFLRIKNILKKPIFSFYTHTNNYKPIYLTIKV